VLTKAKIDIECMAGLNDKNNKEKFELMTEFYPTLSWVTKQQYENSSIR
jgi:hypothetical protein